jgi:hypothetical protein
LQTETILVADASAPDGTSTRVRTTLGGRRQPTRDEVASINERLKAFEAGMDKPAAPAAAPSADAVPVVEVNKPAAAG